MVTQVEEMEESPRQDKKQGGTCQDRVMKLTRIKDKGKNIKKQEKVTTCKEISYLLIFQQELTGQKEVACADIYEVMKEKKLQTKNTQQGSHSDLMEKSKATDKQKLREFITIR